jgi:transcriptional regulator with XRE-family HTH domain
MTLAELRRAKHMTQVQVAVLMGTGQSNVSRIERTSIEQLELPTLQRYLNAIDSRLRLLAELDGRTVEILAPDAQGI